MAKLDPKPVPGFEWLENEDGHNYFKRTEEELNKLIQKMENLPDGEIVGAVMRFPIADGYAFYMVSKARPLTFKHIPIGDSWQIPDAHMRGINKKDILEYIDREKR